MPRALWRVSPSFAFSFVKTFAKIIENGAVADISLAIAKRIKRCGESVGDLVRGTKASYLLAGKVYSIVKDYGIGELKAVHYVLPEELVNMLPGDFKERHCFDPFGEIVGGYQQKPQLRLHMLTL